MVNNDSIDDKKEKEKHVRKQRKVKKPKKRRFLKEEVVETTRVSRKSSPLSQNDKRRVSLVLDFDNKGFFVAAESPSLQVSGSEYDEERTDEFEESDHGEANAEAEWLARVQSTVDAEQPKQTNAVVLGKSDSRSSLPPNAWLLVVMMAMVGCFAVIELIVGFVSDSLALLADSFHMTSDLLSLIVGFVAMWLAAKRQKTSRKTYGWKRAEVIGALINGVFLVSVCFYTVTEAVVRLVEGPPLLRQPVLILIVGGVGLLINIVGLAMFCSHRSLAHHGHSHGHSHGHGHGNENQKGSSSNVNMHGVFLHVLSDALGSIIVIGTVLIYLFAPNNSDGSVATWKPYLDPCCSIVFSAFILRSAIPLLKHTIGVLMQSVPSNIDLEQLRFDIEQLPGVFSVHDLHVWQLVGAESVVGTVHVVCKAEADRKTLFRSVKRIFCKYRVHKTTVQYEDRHEKYSRRAESPCKREEHFNDSSDDCHNDNNNRTGFPRCRREAEYHNKNNVEDHSAEHSCCQMTSTTDEE